MANKRVEIEAEINAAETHAAHLREYLFNTDSGRELRIINATKWCVLFELYSTYEQLKKHLEARLALEVGE